MITKPFKDGIIHIIGIGGIGMSGIAEVLNARGYTVQGSDMAPNANTDRLIQKGIHVFIGHKAEAVKDAQIVVCSTAIKPSNPEIVAAKKDRIPVINRAQMLSELMRGYNAVAISGTHGKTTTTSMVGYLLNEMDPTIINGGIINSLGNNVKIGKSDWMVVEADESDGTFTRIPATIPVVTNIDPEHMEYYGTFQNLLQHFETFVSRMAFYGFAVLCHDHPQVRALYEGLRDRRCITYGLTEGSDFHGYNMRPQLDGTLFSVKVGANILAEDIFLPMHGSHNVQNALAAMAVASNLGISSRSIVAQLKKFGGVKRRFTPVATINGVRVIDDYAHHPEEIKATLAAARSAAGGKVIAIFQPHRYSRLSNLFDAFLGAFGDADMVIVTPVYSAQEDPLPGIDHKTFTSRLKKVHKGEVIIAETPDAVASALANDGYDADLAVFLGAGDITKWAYAMPSLLEPLLKKVKNG